ncbi:MAG: hypothetical protein Q4Q18_08050 [Methanobrevibacter sp.]|nr:hypothetical protein [Methanobrevibacter sp.]
MVEKIVNLMFDEYNIQAKLDKEHEEFYFPLWETISKITDCDNPKEYLENIINKERENGIEISINSRHVKNDLEEIEVINAKDLFRIVQIIPSPQAEPIKLWLAEKGLEGLDEIKDPELKISKVIDEYRQKGRSEEWISQKLESINNKNRLLSFFELGNPI